MSFENEFFEMMPEVVTVEPFLHYDSFGAITYGSPKQFRARVVGKGLSLRKKGEEDVSVVYDVYLTGIPIGETARVPVTSKDRLTLPDSNLWEDTTPEIYAVARYTDEHSFHHYKIQCGFMYHRQGQ